MSPRRLSRREFLAGLGATGVVVASGYGISTWTRGGGSSSPTSTSPRAGRAVEPTSAPARTLVLLELGGGNDRLNMAVPHGDPAYRDLRPTLGITDAIDLDGQIGLSPKLVTLAGEYRAGRVAIVEGIAVPNPSLSHFASLQRWWTADPDLHSETGWIGRYLDRAVGRDDPIAGVAIGPGPSPVLAGMTSFSTSIAGADGLQPGRFDDDVRDALLHAWASLVPSTPGNDLVADVQRAIGATLDARVRLARDLTGSTATDDSGSPDLVDALTLAARLAGSPERPRVVHVHVEGDFDTHQGEAERHPALMADLDAGVKAFVSTLDELHATDSVALATMSEFGRRAGENGSGTDHGTAAAHFVWCTGAKGGRHGEPPSLRNLDPDGNLVGRVDYRAYDATLLEWLDPKTDVGAVLGQDFRTLGIFA
jgi:uncharacterized protein (DUF1501 family)